MVRISKTEHVWELDTFGKRRNPNVRISALYCTLNILSIDATTFFCRPDIVIALSGNKSDLANRRAVEFEEANGYAEENGLLFMETSAKNANNVNEIFLAIARKLPR